MLLASIGLQFHWLVLSCCAGVLLQFTLVLLFVQQGYTVATVLLTFFDRNRGCAVDTAVNELVSDGPLRQVAFQLRVVTIAQCFSGLTRL